MDGWMDGKRNRSAHIRTHTCIYVHVCILNHNNEYKVSCQQAVFACRIYQETGHSMIWSHKSETICSVYDIEVGFTYNKRVVLWMEFWMETKPFHFLLHCFTSILLSYCRSSGCWCNLIWSSILPGSMKLCPCFIKVALMISRGLLANQKGRKKFFLWSFPPAKWLNQVLRADNILVLRIAHFDMCFYSSALDFMHATGHNALYV